ncbi:App1 family protein [Larkinella insperata]|uniref:App1 family protein n=1 Tax=Larkinella insperata TaxID=332158 RepID=A0ABW3QLT7_9BACT|nr:phosphatase domain-containing protein [Larkinella insperata]
MTWLRISDKPVVKVYRGYVHQGTIVVFGHVLRRSALPRKKYRQNFWSNSFALLRLFMARPVAGMTVKVAGIEEDVRHITEKDGFFRLEWKPDKPLSPGWHPVKVELITANLGQHDPITAGEGEVFQAHSTQYGFISDIDDTFLISHSANLRKRLHVLLTENAYSRDPFEDVVEHYQLLARAGTDEKALNPFFYVSSSEWNLYDYILTFCEKNGIPDGVFLLNQIKQLREVWKTGQNKHLTKFTRIVRILEAFPEMKFVLLGDDTQEDPNIYASLVQHFPRQIRCVYLRRVHEKNEVRTQGFVDKVVAAGVPCCYFKHSSEAIRHSVQIGLVEQVHVRE